MDGGGEADWLVELGPGGGPAGGEIIYQGPLAGLLTTKRSPTAPYLRAKLERKASLASGRAGRAALSEPARTRFPVACPHAPTEPRR